LLNDGDLFQNTKLHLPEESRQSFPHPLSSPEELVCDYPSLACTPIAMLVANQDRVNLLNEVYLCIWR
jgi:hypothetical protein